MTTTTVQPRSTQPSHGEIPLLTQTWTIIAATDYAAAGYLPPWVEVDSSTMDIPPHHLATELPDLTHHHPFPGQRIAVALTDDQPAPETVILSGSIDCALYSEDPTSREPVANLQLIDDYWLTSLDPDQLATIATRLRTQADHLDHQIRRALIAARTDWTAHHNA